MGDAARAVMHDTAPALAGTAALLAELRHQGACRFDPAGWQYLDALAQRAAQYQGAARRLLDARLEQAVAAFAERFAQARAAAAALRDAAAAQYPESAAPMHGLFACGDFQGMRHLHARLAARAHCAPLASLVAQLSPAPAANAAAPAATQPSARDAALAATRIELKTVRESRATWARLSVDRQLLEAMRQAPKNAGPINSHMLVLRSLAMMQSISPDYLSHIVSHIDTLLSLHPGEKEALVKRKKTTPAKAVRSTRAGPKPE